MPNLDARGLNLLDRVGDALGCGPRQTLSSRSREIVAASSGSYRVECGPTDVQVRMARILLEPGPQWQWWDRLRRAAACLENKHASE